MEKLSIEGKIVEASWYGKNKGEVALGGYFHSKRLKIISSQGSKIPKYMKNKYDFEGRLKLAIKSLKNSKLEKLITSESNFFNLENLNLLVNKPELGEKILVKVRSTGKLLEAKIKLKDQNKAEVHLKDTEDGISPGQACVFYKENENGYKVLGGGWIKN